MLTAIMIKERKDKSYSFEKISIFKCAMTQISFKKNQLKIRLILELLSILVTNH